MPNDKHDPLNPDSEQQLFERLSNTDKDMADLDTIRRMMRAIVQYEQRVQNDTPDRR